MRYELQYLQILTTPLLFQFHTYLLYMLHDEWMDDMEDLLFHFPKGLTNFPPFQSSLLRV